MIRETLTALQSGGQTTEDVASRLSIGREEMRRRLELLEERGYVERLKEVDCPVACPGCRGAGLRGCSGRGLGAEVYALTDKGARAVDRDARAGRIREGSC